MEPNRNEIKTIDYAKAYANEVFRGGLPPSMQWTFEGIIPHLMKEQDPIITEDIPYEIVENKMLPLSTNKNDQI